MGHMPKMIAPKVLSWASDLEPQAAEQAARSAALPFVHDHIALMPDAHWGMGATIGSVIPTKGAVVPAAVGVDIGCGMIAAELNLTASDLPDDLKLMHAQIARDVPAGVGRGRESLTAGFDVRSIPNPPQMTDKQWTTAATQMGSLGSGNHFVEVCLDERDHVWLVLHSGSRGIGNKLATQHIECAKGLMRSLFIKLDDPDLAYLVEDTVTFDEYIKAMLWAQDYAMQNRQEMMVAVLAAVRRFVPHVRMVDAVNCHHNFTQREHHGGENVWLTRKGAIQAREGDRGVIPGSMGTASYIVAGLGNPASYNSCSHGAGRRLGRKAAKRELTVESLVKAMEGKAWNGGPGSREGNAAQLLDEHPDAYKDIDRVMADQADLVAIVHTLHQVLNYKGT